MNRVKNTIKFLIFLTKVTKKCHFKPVYYLCLVYYILIRLSSILKMDYKIRCIPNDIFVTLLKKYLNLNKFYADENLYLLCNSKSEDKSVKWFYLCNRSSLERYPAVVIPSKEIAEDYIYLSESMKFNLLRKLNLKNQNTCDGYFLVPGVDKHDSFALEMKISMISNPFDIPGDLMDHLVQSYFSIPKYLRINDIFRINTKDYAPEIKFCTADSKIDTLYFKVNSIETEGKNSFVGNGFIAFGQTTFIQESSINNYLIQKCLCDVYYDNQIYSSVSWPPPLKELLEQLQSCISPFLQNAFYIDIKPIFLVEGPSGSGKYRLVKTASETLGLNFLEADFSDVQSLTSAQTEAKLKMILHDAELRTPCLLMLRNIQNFGHAEGHKDERVLAAFETELKKLYNKKLKFPLIIVATSNDSEMTLDAERTFIEKIVINPLREEQRSEILSWYIQYKGMTYDGDLEKVAKMCSDFTLADLEALVMYATKHFFYQANYSYKDIDDLTLSINNFNYAIEYMQSIFSDQIGSPRVPKVRWEDIGGLADLKREIMHRIEVPLLNISGLGKSGLLLYGPPGTGKTLLAKAVATECHLHFLSVKGPELLNMYVGQSEKNVREVFERARAASPCIIFFDELDSLVPNRGLSGDSGGVMDRVVSQLLAEMDGLESSGQVFIMGATNRPDLIDPALLRPGRFDKMLYVGMYTDTESQKGVLKALTRQFNLEEDGKEVDKLLAELPNNLTGADLYSICSSAWLRAVGRLLTGTATDEEKKELRGKDVIVNFEDFVQANKDLVPSVSKEELLRYEKLRNELPSS